MSSIDTIVEVVRRLLTEDPLLVAVCLIVLAACFALIGLIYVSKPQ